MRYLKYATLTLLIIVLAACGSTSTNGSSSHPAGIDQATWDDYCSHGAALLGYVNQASKGTITPDEYVTKLNGSQNGIQSDADATTDAGMRAKFQAITDAIGRTKVAVATGDVPDYSALVNAVGALPAC